MLLIFCPHCGPRNDSEFTYQGQFRVRPGVDTARAAWRQYLYFESNTADWATERWFHRSGCRRFLIVERHTVSNAIRKVRDVADGD